MTSVYIVQLLKLRPNTVQQPVANGDLYNKMVKFITEHKIIELV